MALEICDLTATYGEGTVLHGVSLTAKPGMVTALVGRNGAGKTTTLKALMGLVTSPSGTVSLDGKDLTKLPAYERARAGIGYVPQGREIFPQLTVKENLELGMEANPEVRSIPEDIFETFPVLKEFLGRRGGDLSGGQQQQLAIARALVAKPRVLVLDEPTEGIQPSVIQEIGRVITRLKQNVAVLLVEQYLEFALDIADDVYVIEKGEIVQHGKPGELDEEKLKETMSL
ncbi:urea ABC transporter ATP-binding subunit UrtE [Collinsella sp. An2]|uniref:urea ABC transporter ATP-binding subunit UrtE n=1 Tax=Collinsella sp. An2 TaxID=1965585 RepID=UPI000B36EC8F|nr:urea ABC transporter ATP-binding subunit UrtE [Collinsella sp. An2]OUP10953.1 urea ABC transporter ATP-binding subunit UrtE [Collinsella sp. An2]